MSNITEILASAASGNGQATDALFSLVYDELRRLAASQMASERPGQTLDATGLVHEAYLRLVGSKAPPTWDGRGHFFAAAAEAMRRILIENARRKQTAKRGGGLQRSRAARTGSGDRYLRRRSSFYSTKPSRGFHRKTPRLVRSSNCDTFLDYRWKRRRNWRASRERRPSATGRSLGPG